MAAPHTNNGVSDIFTITSSDGAKATVHSQGGHITSWTGKDGDERLYMSPNAVYQAGKALRGGVPVIYPQFSDMGSGAVHGAARNRQWTRIDNGSHGDGQGVFEIFIHKEDVAFVGYESRLTLTVTVSDSELKLTAKVDKTTEDGTTAKDFGFAFHSYFAVSDISNIKLKGFDKLSYADNLKNREVVLVADAQPVTVISQEVDRIYTNVQTPLTIVDEKFELSVFGENLPDVVLWNPWAEKNARLSDLPQPDGFRSFLCIEHGALIPRVAFPKPGQSWEGSQVITFKKL